MSAEYTLYVRELDTLNVIGEIVNMSYLKVGLDVHNFAHSTFMIHIDSIAPEYIEDYRVYDVYRDGLYETSFILLESTIDDRGMLTLGGPDLKWFLSTRDSVVTPAAAVPIETFMKNMVTANMGDTAADANRRMSRFLTTADFVVEATAGAGGTLTAWAATQTNMLEDNLIPLAMAGGLRHYVCVDNETQEYRYGVVPYVNKTLSTLDPVIVSMDLLTAQRISYSKQLQSIINHVYVRNSGATVLSLADDPNQLTHLRREATITSDKSAAIEANNLITSSLLRSVQIEATPFVQLGLPYREAWELGDEVSIIVPYTNTRFDKLITNIDLVLTEDGEEKIEASFAGGALEAYQILMDVFRRSRIAT